MHFLTATLGLALPVLIGIASVLAPVILVLYEARWIAAWPPASASSASPSQSASPTARMRVMP